MGIGDWGLGIGDWGLGPIPNPQLLFLNFCKINFYLYKTTYYYYCLKITILPILKFYKEDLNCLKFPGYHIPSPLESFRPRKGTKLEFIQY